MKEILVFKPQFNKEERLQITTLCDELWGILGNIEDPTPMDKYGISFFVRHSFKVQKQNGVVTILDTSSEPYAPIYNRYVLKLLLGNILLD